MPISEERGGGRDYSKIWPPWIIIKSFKGLTACLSEHPVS